MSEEQLSADTDVFAEEVDMMVVKEAAMPSLTARIGAEILGTFVLVLLGVGTALFAASTGNTSLAVGVGFAIGVVIAATVFGSVSGAHLNPAVTLGVWLAGRMRALDVAFYIIAQVIGALLAGLVLYGAVLSIDAATDEVTRSFISTAANGFGENAPLAAAGFTFGPWVAFVVEAIATGLLLAVVLAVTRLKASAAVAPFVIGGTLGGLVMLTIPFTNAALNPARATATAIFGDAWAAQQLWMFWLAPLVGAAIVGLLFRLLGPDADMLEDDE